MNRIRSSTGSFALASLVLIAQAGLAFEDRTPRVHALVGARVVTAPGKTLDTATVVLRDGLIEAVGDVEVPADARVWDLHGKTIYPGLIEAYFETSAAENGDEPGDQPDGGNRHPNARVRAEVRALDGLGLKKETLEELRGLGFTSVHVVPARGVFRGRSVLVNLQEAPVERRVIRKDVAQHVAYERSRWGDQNPTYPSSIMGVVALIRQTLLDAQWLQQAQAVYTSNPRGLERPASNASLDALQAVVAGDQPIWIQTTDILSSLRSVDIAQEFDLSAVLLGNGEEYQGLDRLEAAGLAVVLPLDFPKAPEIEEEDEEVFVELDVLEHWQKAPANAARLRQAGIRLALTTHGLEKRKDFGKRVRQAIEAGLTPDDLLAALTTTPAALLGVSHRIGDIVVGKVANLTVSNGELFGKDVEILEVWVDGRRFDVHDTSNESIAKVRGAWTLVERTDSDEGRQWRLEVKGNRWTLRARLEDSRGEVPISRLTWQEGELIVNLATTGETIRLRPAGKELEGIWRQTDGKETEIAARRPVDPATGGGR